MSHRPWCGVDTDHGGDHRGGYITDHGGNFCLAEVQTTEDSTTVNNYRLVK